MSSSHASSPRPSPLLALVALGIVHRLRPAWLAVDLKDAAHQQNVRAERLSRLVTAVIAGFESMLATLTRRGRPPRSHDEDDARPELALTRELLAVATALLARAAPRRSDGRALVVGAWLRLASQPGMTQRRFCDALALPDRTLRAWLTQPAAAPNAPSPPSSAAAPKPPRPPRRRRFGFDVTLPGTQVAADTTDLRVLGMPLKLIAAQDVGGRDASLFDTVLVDDHESAELVVEVFGKALADKPGAQAITDQGTPYLAHETREALSRLEVEHAPQKDSPLLFSVQAQRAKKNQKDEQIVDAQGAFNQIAGGELDPRLPSHGPAQPKRIPRRQNDEKCGPSPRNAQRDGPPRPLQQAQIHHEQQGHHRKEGHGVRGHSGLPLIQQVNGFQQRVAGDDQTLRAELIHRVLGGVPVRVVVAVVQID